jgi:hypothetical protein
VWVASHFIYYFTTDLEAFTEFSQAVFKKIFKFDTIPSSQIKTILSMFTEQPKLNDLSSLFKVPVNLFELCSLMCKLIACDDAEKLKAIIDLQNSSGL